jgi:putative cardiolipin synthase
MNRTVLAISTICILTTCAYGAAPSEFRTWLKQDNALRKSASSSVNVGDFTLKLPLGWIVDEDTDRDAGATLTYVGTKATGEPPQVCAVLTVSAAPARERGGPSEAWPSAFSGWTTFQAGELWAVRATLPGDRAGTSRLAVQVPTSLATLTLEALLPHAAGNWPGYIANLIQGVVYRGTGVPLAPPGQGDARSRASAPVPPVEVSPQALANSPLHTYVVKTRQSLHKGVDPATENSVAILDTGADALLARLHLIRSATQSIRIQTYIWGDDEVGRLMLYELIEAAKRGVNVQVIMDHISSFRDVELAAFVATVSPNLTLRHYRPAAKRIDPAPLQETLDLLIPNGTNQRMHNKILVVDNVAVITGGRNIDNSYYAQSETLNFRDRDVLLIGPMTAYAVRSFEEYRTFEKCVRTARLKDVEKVIERGKFKRLETRDDFALNGYFQDIEKTLADGGWAERFASQLLPVDKALFLADPPGKQSRRYTAWRRGTIAKQLESIMASAEKSLVLQTPYLILDGGMLKLFQQLREANPDIDLRTSSNSFGATDNPLAYAANFKMRPAYMKAGINVYEYMHNPADVGHQLPNYDVLLKRNVASRGQGTFHQKNKPFLCIHAKGLVVDDAVAFVGSYNFDPRSISLNTEVGLLVEDAAFAARVKGDIDRDASPENSWVVARRKEPRSPAEVARSMPQEVSRAHIDLWPFRFTSGYELKAGQFPAPPTAPHFYSNYDDIGVFPGADDEGMATKKILTHLSTILSDLAIPLL